MNDVLSQLGEYFDGCATAQQEEALFEAVVRDPEVADQFITCALLMCDLREIESSVGRNTVSPPMGVPTARTRGRWMVRAGVVAAGILLAAIAGWLFHVDSSDQQTLSPAIETASENVGSVVRMAGEIFTSKPLTAGGAIDDAPIRVGAGELELILNSGALINVQSQSQFAVLSPMQVQLTSGLGIFNCPPSAHGFTVHLPGGARTVDLGTRFAVQVDEQGRSEVWVYEGAVELVDSAEHTRVDAGWARAVIDGQVRPIDALIGQSNDNEAPGRVIFETDRIGSYIAQDAKGNTTSSFEVLEGGRTLRLSGNAWKTIPLAYQVQSNTVIELEFRSAKPGEIHAIGFDRKSDNPPRYGVIQLAGKEVDVSFPPLGQPVVPRRWTKLTVPIGQYYTGPLKRLLLVSDDDADSNAEGWFRNVHIYEPPKENQP